MMRYIIVASLLVLAACKSKTKTETTVSGENKSKDTLITPGKDSTSNTGPAETGTVDMESFGPIKLGQDYSRVLEAIGTPDSKSKAIEWGADGLLHEDWTWKKNGLEVNMSSDKKNIDSTLSIFSITAMAPCDFKTRAGAGIGSSYARVEAAYKNNIDPYTTNKNQITVGDQFGGIIFSFKDDKVSKVFLGASAE